MSVSEEVTMSLAQQKLDRNFEWCCMFKDLAFSSFELYRNEGSRLCVRLCRGMFFFCHKHWLDILCTRNVFFFLESFMWVCFCDICHLGDGAVQKECTLVWGIHCICLQTSFRKHENHKKNYIDTFLHLNILHWHAWILSCLELSFRWRFLKKKYSHTFVLMCSYNCLD